MNEARTALLHPDHADERATDSSHETKTLHRTCTGWKHDVCLVGNEGANLRRIRNVNVLQLGHGTNC